MADNSKNLKLQKDQFDKLIAASKEYKKHSSDSVEAMREMYAIIQALQKGFISMSKEGNKFSDLLTAMSKGGLDLKNGMSKLTQQVHLSEKAVDELAKAYSEVSKKSIVDIKNMLKHSNSQIEGAEDLLKVLEDTQETQENITDEIKNQSDALEDLFKISENTEKKAKEFISGLRQQSFQANYINKSFGELLINFDDLAALSKQIDPIIDTDPAKELDSAIENIEKAFTPLSNSEFTIDGNTSNFEEAVIAAHKYLADQEFETIIKVNARNIAGAEGFAKQLQADFLQDVDKEIQFAEILRAKITDQIESATRPLDVNLSDTIAMSMDNLDQMFKDAVTAFSDIEVDVITHDDKSVEYIMKAGKATEEQLATAEALMATLKETGNIEMAAWVFQEAAMRKDAIHQQEKLKLLQSQLDVLGKYRGPISALENLGDQLQDSLRGAFGQLPGWLQQIAGTSKITSVISQQWGTAINNISSDLQKGVPFTTALKTNFAAMRTSVIGMLNPWTIALGIIAGMVALLIGLENNVKNISKELGVSRGMAAGIYEQSQAIVGAWDNQLTTQEDVLSVMKKHQEKYGVILDLNKEANQESIKFAANLGKQYGLAAGEVYGMSQQFALLGADQGMSDNLTAWIAKSAELSGIPFGEIQKDLVESSELIATHFNGMPKMAARAAVEAKRMGMSLKQVGGLMEKTLDVNSFLTDMSELNAMTGGMADLSGVFEMRFSGADPVEIAKATAAEWDNLPDSMKNNEFIAKKFANATGMTVEELRKGEKVRERMRNLSGEQLALVEKHGMSLSDEALANNKLAVMEASRLDTQEKFGVAWEKLKGELMTGLLPLIESFGEGLSAVIPIISLIGKALGGVAKVVNIMLWPFQALFKILGGIADAVTVGSFDPLVKAAESAFGSIVDSVKGMFSSAGSVIAGIVGTIILSYTGGFAKIGKLYGKFFGMFKNIGLDSIKKVTSGMLDKFSGAFGGIKEKISGLFSGSITDKFSGAVDKIKEKISGIFGGSKKAAENAATSVTDTVSGASGGSGNAQQGMGDSITDSIDDTTTSANNVQPKAGENLKDFFKNLAEGLKAMGDGNVWKGALALIPTSLGLVAMIPGTLGAKLIEKLDGGKLGEGLTGMATGLNAMAKGKVALGALALVAAGIGFVAMTAGAIGMAAVAFLAAPASAGLTALAAGLSAFGGAAMNPLTWLGVALLGAIGIALIPFGIALGKAAPAIEAFAPVISSFGDIISSVFSGIAGVITAITDGFVNMFTALTSVDGAQLMATAVGITAVGAAMLAFGGGSALGGIGSAIGSLFGGDPIKKFSKLAALAKPMDLLANALNRVADAMDRIRGVKPASAASQVTTSLESKPIPDESPNNPKNNDMNRKMAKTSMAPDNAPDEGLYSPENIDMNRKMAKTSMAPDNASPTPGVMQPNTMPQDNNRVATPGMIDRPDIKSAVPPPTPQKSEATAPEINSGKQSTEGHQNNMMMKELIRAVNESSNRPLKVYIGDTELRTFNKKIKALNNY